MAIRFSYAAPGEKPGTWTLLVLKDEEVVASSDVTIEELQGLSRSLEQIISRMARDIGE